MIRSSEEPNQKFASQTMNAKSREPKKIGPYRLVEQIGSGGQGAVWRAFKGEGNEAVAVKVLRFSHPKKRARFVREVNTHAALTAKAAPNVMPLIDHNLEETANEGVKGYLVMPLAEVSLHDEIETLRGRLELSLEVLSGVATGLAAAHREGVIHRDLKPGNILFKNRALREPLISDFGIALLRETPGEERITEAGETVGAKYFMAPEQEHGGVSDVTFSADVYAAGKLLHFMLTGRYLSREHLEKAFTAEELTREPRLQVVLDEVLARCIVESPADRIPDGTALLEVCQRLLTSFRAPSGNGSSHGSLRKSYDAFTQLFAADDSRASSLVFDQMQDELRLRWLDLHPRYEGRPDETAQAAGEYVRSLPAPMAATFAMARVDADALFPHLKRLLEFATALSDGIAGYPGVASVPRVQAGFLYMACSVFALHHESWRTLEKLLTVPFKWSHQSPQAFYSYGFAHPYFFHVEALHRDATQHNDLFRSILIEPPVVEVTRLDRERLLDVYAQTDLLMSLRAAQLEIGGEDASRWADFGRFYEERVTPLLERIQLDPEYADGVLRAFGESREQFFAQLNPRLLYIRERFFDSARWDFASVREWHQR
jgi:serine/threonine protein kinase